MATSKAPKQPPFPHPPLEVGVPQYPTPLVPDFYTKDGHIILVVKESVEKGNYNPQPLDGSITYQGRDANKFPSTLYLVYQRPTDDSQFVYNTYANDRTLSSQDPWNYGLDYSGNNPDYPVTSRTYITPRSQYSSVALGSTDPVFGGSQIISQQKMVELGDDNPLRSRYVAVQRVYETIPGPVLTGEKLDERGDIETITTQTVTAGTMPEADGLLVSQTAVQPVDSVKSTKTYGTVVSHSTLTTKANKSGLLGDTSTTDDVVDPTTAPDDLSITTLESTVEQLTVTKARKRTTTSSGPTELDGKSLGEYGYITTAESIIGYSDSLPSPNESTVKLDKQPIDSSKSKLVNYSYDSINTLSGYQYDDFFQQNLSITKQLVAAGTSQPSITDGILSYKDDPVDFTKTLRTIVSTPALPPTRTEYKTGTFTSPLLVFGQYVEFANLSCALGDFSEIRIKITPNTRAAQSRQTVFKTVTSYSYGPPTPQDTGILSPALSKVSYTGFIINFDYGSALCDHIVAPNLGPDGTTGVPAHYCTVGGLVVPNVFEYWDIPATSISATAYLALVGTYQKISWESRYWKSNIWESKTIYCLIP